MSASLLEEAWRSHRAGDHARAERLYKDLLRVEPRNFSALYRLGFLCGEGGRFADAERFMGEALILDPLAADVHFLRGAALMQLSRGEEAIACFDRPLR
jgi:tetratricopeptide (TPR) repeat protein